MSTLERRFSVEVPSSKPIILYLAANPSGTTELALAREARAIQDELLRSGHGDKFELVTRWAVQPMDLLRELRKTKPTIVHFSGHGCSKVASHGLGEDVRREIANVSDPVDATGPDGLFFETSDGTAQLVSSYAIAQTFGAVGSSVKAVILSSCHSSYQAQALLEHVGCVVSMSSSIRDDAARHFAVGFYGGLSDEESLAEAFRQGRAAISLEGIPESVQPRLQVRGNVDAEALVLVSATTSASSKASRDLQSGSKVVTYKRKSNRQNKASEVPSESRPDIEELET